MPNARPPLPPWVPSAGSRARLTVAVTLLLVAAALFNPPSPFAAPSTPILLLDESLSMAGAGETWPVLSRAVREATGSNRVQLIPFGAQVLPHIDTSLNAPAPPSSQLDRTGTNIEVALRAAFDVASAHQPIVLWSDGRETRGAATPLLADAARHGRRVYSLQVPPPTSGAVLVDVDLPVRVTEGALFPVVVRARSVTAGLATLDVFRDDKLAESHTFELRAGAPSASVVSLAARGRQPFDLRFRLAADPAGGWDESELVRTVHPHGKAHVLYVGHTPPFPLAGSLLRGGWSVTHADPSRLASGVDPEADVVVLDNIAIGDVEEAGWRALAQAVRKRGTGLVLLGGKRSLGAGGYRHSTLESLLPVTAQASADPELATAIFLIDKSGSMDRAAAGRSAFAYAREAVQLTAASLEGDRIGITTFDVNARVLLPVGTHEDFAAAAKRAWRDVRPGGGTLLTSGLTSALDQFDETNGQKLLILVTDGFTEAHGDDSTAGLTHLADTIARKRVDIIALGIGADASLASLQQLTTANDGVLLQLDDVAHIPRLMLAATGAKRGAVEEGAILPVQRQPLPFLALAPETRWPMLRGYTVTRPRADATVYLETARGDPLVVTGHAGLGHVVVLTGGLGRWAGAWHKWPQWGALAAGLVEWSAQSPSANLHLDLVRETESYRIIADVMDQAGNWVAAYDGMLPAHLAGPDDIHRELSLSATAPGRYDAALPLTREGRYRLTVGSGDVAERRDFHYEATAEHAGGEGKLGAWREAALITPLEDYDASRHETRRPLRTLLTAAALLFYCASLVPLINRANHPHPRPHRS